MTFGTCCLIVSVLNKNDWYFCETEPNRTDPTSDGYWVKLFLICIKTGSVQDTRFHTYMVCYKNLHSF